MCSYDTICGISYRTVQYNEYRMIHMMCMYVYVYVILLQQYVGTLYCQGELFEQFFLLYPVLYWYVYVYE